MESNIQSLGTTTFVIEPDSPDNIERGEDSQEIKAATVDKLIEALTNTQEKGVLNMEKIFFLTYRSFMSPHELMKKLILRYKQLVEIEDKVTVLRYSHSSISY